MSKEFFDNNKKFLFQIKSIDDKEKEIVLNKEIKQIIEYKRKQQHLEDVYITTVERSFFTYCCCLIKNDKSIEQKDLKYKLFEASNKEINKKIDALSFIKTLEQFNLIKKIVLNESQCYMLQNRELKRIIDTKIKTVEQENQEELETEKENKNKLLAYLNKKNQENSLSSVDLMLVNYLEPELKIEVKNYLKID